MINDEETAEPIGAAVPADQNSLAAAPVVAGTDPRCSKAAIVIPTALAAARAERRDKEMATPSNDPAGTPDALENAKAAVVTVGLGRGFVVELGDRRYVVTAAHCLADDEGKLPFPCYPAETNRCSAVLASLGTEPTVTAECAFADPVGDIAVLGMPDPQGRPGEAEAYEKLTEAATPIPIADVGAANVNEDCQATNRAWILSLDGRRFRCTTTHLVGPFFANGPIPLWLSDATEPIRGGMS